MTTRHGALLISIDFELYWGVRDKRSLASYQENLAGVWQAIPRTLALFSEMDIHVTWATVGLLFCKDRREARHYAPGELPTYVTPGLSPYDYLASDEALDPRYHFCPELIDQIAACPNQEIATHTFSHFYCQEAGQTLDAFAADLDAALAVARDRRLRMRSIVFPRNQWNSAYLPALKRRGIQCFRGNEPNWFYRAVESSGQGLLRRAGRFIDTYANLCGHQTYVPAAQGADEPYNFPASRFLRPYSKRLALLEPLRLRRIRQALRHAAKHGQVFHLWWHPHNFGVDTDRNMIFLQKVLREFSELRSRYGMQSLTMAELCEQTEAAYGLASPVRSRLSKQLEPAS
jgi:peptidoglycan/xylan/chitin deacetylase (PgdA/CDA1 family)